MTLISIAPTAALLMFLCAGLLVTRNWVLGIAFGLLGLYSGASVAVLIGLGLGANYNVPALIVFAAGVPTLGILWAVRNRQFPTLLSWLGVFGFFLLSIVSQIVSRVFGLSSVAFTDGHTIMLLGQTFQGANDELLDGTKALKRGFGLPALQSFGFEGEYLVGFMPLFFVGALLTTFYLIWLLSPNRGTFALASVVILAIVFSTEAVLRHLYLMNTHATAWLLTSLFLVMTLKYFREALRTEDIILVVLAFATIAFLRLDFVMLFAPFILAFVLLTAPISKKLAFGSLVAVAAPLWAWMTFATVDFPFGGSIGPTLMAVAGLIAGGFVVLIQSTAKRPLDPLRGNLFLVMAGVVLVITLATTRIPDSSTALFINLFMGEGLWGFTPHFLLLIWVTSLFFRKRRLEPDFARAALRLGLASVAVYLFTKYLDGATVGQSLPNFARIGFGDSLNRTLITWLPFALLPLISVVSALISGSNLRGSSTVIDKIR